MHGKSKDTHTKKTKHSEVGKLVTKDKFDEFFRKGFRLDK